jgi:GntR family transcriptional regulator
VTLIKFTLQPGESIFDQVVYAAKKAFISGEFLPGQPFPSVRALAASLKIHPNTAHKVVQHLSTIVAEMPEVRSGDRKRLLLQEVEQLVVEARRVGVDLAEVVKAVETQWARFEPANPVEKKRK